MLAKFSGGDYAGALCALDDDGFVARARIDPILGARVAQGVSRTHFDALVSKARQTAVVQYFVPCVVSFLFLFPLLDDACDRLSPLFSPCESRRLALAPSCAPRRVSLPLRPLTDRVFPPSLPSCITPSVCPLSSLRLILTSFLSAPARAQWERDKVGGEGVRGQNFAVPPAGGPGTHRTFYDIPGFLEQDDAFLEVVDLPAVVALVGRLCGTAPDRGAPLPQSHGFPPSEQSPPGIC